MAALPPNWILAFGYILAAITGGFALYYWRRSTGLYALLVEGANRYEELRSRGQQAEQQVLAGKEKEQQTKASLSRLELALDEARATTASLSQQLETKSTESKYISEKLELQKAHLEKQLTKMTEQARVSEVERSHAEERHKLAVTDLEQRLHRQQRDLAQKLQEATTQLEVLTAEKNRLEKVAAAADPEDMRRLKRKLLQYDRLYSSMKGLREMADERNDNWEVALRKLSTWIVKEKGGVHASLPEAIGPLVGQALHAIGAQLIDDHDILARPTAMHLERPIDNNEENLGNFDPLVKDTLTHAASLGQMDQAAKILRG